MKNKVTKAALVVGVTVLGVAPMGVAHAEIEGFEPTLTYGSVEAIPNPTVVDTTPLRSTSLAVIRGLPRQTWRPPSCAHAEMPSARGWRSARAASRS